MTFCTLLTVALLSTLFFVIIHYTPHVQAFHTNDVLASNTPGLTQSLYVLIIQVAHNYLIVVQHTAG